MLSSLSKEQAKTWEVHVAIPYLANFKTEPTWTGRDFPTIEASPFANSDASKILMQSRFREAEFHGAHLYFFDSPLFRDLPGIYQNSDEHFRFAVYSYACFYLSVHLQVDIFHCHDWHTALGPALQKASPWGKPSVFTIHNLAYQGDHPEWMTGFLEEEPFFLSRKPLEHNGRINYMKGGIASASQITTVSPGYRDETLWEPNGFGLSSLLSIRREDYTGILNGLDPEEWNPKIDKNIFYPYSIANAETEKQKNKIELYKEIERPKIDPLRPLVGIIGRLTFQKGYSDFLKAFLDRPNLAHFFIFLGAGDPDLEGALFHQSHHNQNRLFFFKGYNETFARKIEAASDFFLMPSLFEPCGLNQLYSHAYGSIPIVSRVGGLRDSVDESIFMERQTGIVFEPKDPGSLAYALERAETLYKDQAKFRTIREQIMRLDWSWKRRIPEYAKVYQKAIDGE